MTEQIVTISTQRQAVTRIRPVVPSIDAASIVREGLRTRALAGVPYRHLVPVPYRPMSTTGVEPSTAEMHESTSPRQPSSSDNKPKKLTIKKNINNDDKQQLNVEQQLLSPEDAEAVLALITLAKNSKRTSADTAPTVAKAPEPEVASIETPTKFVCDECGKYYATSSNLSRHKQTHRSLNSELAQRCRDCNKVYVSMSALAMHTLTHRMRHSCGECGKQFSRPWLLRGHLRSHTGEKPYKCIVCGKSFADRSNLRAHLQTHSPDKKFECLRCSKTFALKTYLNKHQESVCTRLSNN